MHPARLQSDLRIEGRKRRTSGPSIRSRAVGRWRFWSFPGCGGAGIRRARNDQAEARPNRSNAGADHRSAHSRSAATAPAGESHQAADSLRQQPGRIRYRDRHHEYGERQYGRHRSRGTLQDPLLWHRPHAHENVRTTADRRADSPRRVLRARPTSEPWFPRWSCHTRETPATRNRSGSRGMAKPGRAPGRDRERGQAETGCSARRILNIPSNTWRSRSGRSPSASKRSS